MESEAKVERGKESAGVGQSGRIDQREVDTRFTYHTPSDEQTPKYATVRAVARNFAQAIIELTPPSREQSLAITRLEEAAMWANAAIARRSE